MAGRLHLALEGADAEEVRGEVRKLIERVVFTPLPGKGAFDLKVEGKLARLLGVSEGPGACEVLLGAGTLLTLKPNPPMQVRMSA